MQLKRIIASCTLVACILTAVGCEKTDIHEIKPIPKELYQKTISESVVVQKGDMEPELKLKLTQNALRYTTYSVDLPDLEFSELKVSVGDYVKAGQVLVVFKSDKLKKEVDKAREDLDNAKLLLEHTQKMKEIKYDPEKPDDKDNKAILEGYDRDIAALNDDIKYYEIILSEKQRELDKCIIKAKEDGIITFVSNAISNGIVSPGADLITEAAGDVGFYCEVKEEGFEFEVDSVYRAVSPTMDFDVKITGVEETESGSTLIYLKPVSDEVVYVSGEKFEITIPKEKILDVVYVEKAYVLKDADERYYVNVLDENGFKVPTYVEVDAFVEDKAIIKSGLEGGEEVCAR